MTGYTRNDTSNNIADGNVVNADDLDGEFDALQAAFDASSGHVHDGTEGNGAPITKVGPSQDVTISATEMKPKTNNTVILGSATLKFKDANLLKGSVDEIQTKAALGTVVTLTGTTPSIDCFTGDYFLLTTTGSTVFSFDYSNITKTTNEVYAMFVEVISGGSHTLTWPGSVEWPNGVAADSPASGETYIYLFVTRDGGTTWRGVLYGGAFA